MARDAGAGRGAGLPHERDPRVPGVRPGAAELPGQRAGGGALLDYKGFPHDFGTYYEVVCYYDPARPEAVDYAMRCERQGPATWEDGGVRPPPRTGDRKRGRG